MNAAAANRLNGHDPTRDILVEAARRMLPVLVGRVLTAATDRAVDGVDQLADRLGDVAERGLTRRDTTAPDGPPAGGAAALLADGIRRFLDLVVRLLAHAAMTLRTATERLRRRRAPEGIDGPDVGDTEETAAIGA